MVLRYGKSSLALFTPKGQPSLNYDPVSENQKTSITKSASHQIEEAQDLDLAHAQKTELHFMETVLPQFPPCYHRLVVVVVQTLWPCSASGFQIETMTGKCVERSGK